MERRATLADVAKRAGVSSTTASFVLTNRPGTRIAEATAKRIRAAAAELQYRPDPTARSLRTGRTQAVGFVSDEVTLTRYASPMIRGIMDVCAARDHVLIMTETDSRLDELETAVRVLQTRRVDGLLLGLMRARRITLPQVRSSTPLILVNGLASGRAAVLPDEERGGREAIDHLLAAGHTRIAFIGRPSEELDLDVWATIGRRLSGIDRGMAEAGLTFVHEVSGGLGAWEPELGYTGALEVFDSADVTAILAFNDRVAMGVYQAAQERGLTIPDELSVMSFDDEQLASYLRPPVTTMRLPYLEMGRVAMAQLLDGEGGVLPGGAVRETLVPMPLIERVSVRRLN